MENTFQLLKQMLSERISNNPAYSLRTFARDLQITPQGLSNVLNGRKGMSEKMALKISRQLGLSVLDSNLFLTSVNAKYSRNPQVRKLALKRLAEIRKNSKQTSDLDLEHFSIISNWHHYALVSLLNSSKRPKKDTAKMATKLGIPESEVCYSLARLEKLGLVRESKLGWEVKQNTIIADREIPTQAVKKFHEQVIQKSVAALAFQNANERYGSSSTLPFKVKNLERAKKLIQEFRLKFSEEVSDTEDGDEIYALSLQFFRLSDNKISLNDKKTERTFT